MNRIDVLRMHSDICSSVSQEEQTREVLKAYVNGNVDTYDVVETIISSLYKVEPLDSLFLRVNERVGAIVNDVMEVVRDERDSSTEEGIAA